MSETEQLEAPDGSMLITKALVEEAAGYLHCGFGRVWDIFPHSVKHVAAATVLVRAMGYQETEAPAEVLRLQENHFFRKVCCALVEGYGVAREGGLFQ